MISMDTIAGRISTPSARGPVGKSLPPPRGHLGEEGLEGNGLNGRRMRLGYRPGVGEPETEVLQNPSDDLGVLNGGNDSHPVLASGTDQWVRLVHLPD